MRAMLILAALIAGCGHHSDDKTAEHFCTNAYITFEQAPSLALGEARRVLEAGGRCDMLNQTSHDLAIASVAFLSAALPFRDRPEVRRTLDALDKLPVEEVFALHCDEEHNASEAQIGALLPKIDQVRSKLADIVAACRSR